MQLDISKISDTELRLLRYSTDEELRRRRVINATLLYNQKGGSFSKTHAVHFLVVKLLKELQHKRNVILDDILDELECYLED